MLRHIEARPIPDFYESWPTPKFSQPDQVSRVLPAPQAVSKSSTMRKVILGSGEVCTFGNVKDSKIGNGKKRILQRERSQIEVPTFLCGLVIGKVSFL